MMLMRPMSVARCIEKSTCLARFGGSRVHMSGPYAMTRPARLSDKFALNGAISRARFCYL